MKKRSFSSTVRKVFGIDKKKPKFKTLFVFVLGASKTGKSSLINVLCDEEFSDAYSPTVFDIYEKEIREEGAGGGRNNNNKGIKFVFVDISGESSSPATRREYIGKADIFLLVYTSVERDSFKQLLRYKTEIEEVKEERISELSVAIIRNKTDLEDGKVDDKKLRWCRSIFNCSAKYSHNLSHILEFLTTESLCAGNIVEKTLNKGVSGRYIYGGGSKESKSISLVRPKSYYKHNEPEDGDDPK